MPPIKRIEIACAKCNYHYDVEEKFLGKLLTCPKCQAKFYSKASGTALKESMTSAASTAKVIPVEGAGDELKKARRKKILKRSLAAIGLLIIAFFLWKSFKFATRPIDDKPDPRIAYKVAQDFMKDKSGLANIDSAIFSKKFTLDEVDVKNKQYSIRTSVAILLPDQKNPSEKNLSINMKYLGEEQWEYVDYSLEK